MSSAYLLVSHGSRDPRPQIAVTQLAQQLSQWLQAYSPQKSDRVGTAQLELADEPLHIQIVEFALSCGATKVVIIPLFLLAGVHAIEDIPAEVKIATATIGLEIVVTSFLGNCESLADAIAQQRLDLPARSIILAHGSRREGGNLAVEQLASKLGLDAAYWSIAPSLATRVTESIDAGATEIGILLYFLFAGGITDAILELVAQLRQQFPGVRLVLGEPIGYSPELVGTIGRMLVANYL